MAQKVATNKIVECGPTVRGVIHAAGPPRPVPTSQHKVNREGGTRRGCRAGRWFFGMVVKWAQHPDLKRHPRAGHWFVLLPKRSFFVLSRTRGALPVMPNSRAAFG